MNVQETSTGVAQLLRTLPFRELVTFADAMRACADRGADALTCAEAIDAWARGDTDQVDQKYEENDDVCTRDGAEQREHGTQGSDRGDRGEGRERPDGSTGDRASAHGRDDGERAPGLHGSTRGARQAEGRLARVNGTSAASASAADTGSGAGASEGASDGAVDASSWAFTSPNSPAGDDKPAGASSEQENDDGWPSSAADVADSGPSAPAAPLIGNDDAILRAIISLKTDGTAVTYTTIAERSRVPKTSISWHVGSLERKGWIRRSGPAGDRRYEVLAHPDGGALPQVDARRKRPNRHFNLRPHREHDHDRARSHSRAAAGEGACTACGQNPQKADDELCADCAALVTRAGKPASAYGGEPGNLSRTSGGIEADNIITSG